jgi:hypothetical protein
MQRHNKTLTLSLPPAAHRSMAQRQNRHGQHKKSNVRNPSPSPFPSPLTLSRRRKTNPRDFTTGGTLTPIPTGTFVNSTHWQYTFVCRGCAVGKTGFAPAAVKERLAFALGEDAPAALGNRSAPLTFHGLGAAAFSVRLEEARSERFVGWSKLV